MYPMPLYRPQHNSKFTRVKALSVIQGESAITVAERPVTALQRHQCDVDIAPVVVLITDVAAMVRDENTIGGVLVGRLSNIGSGLKNTISVKYTAIFSAFICSADSVGLKLCRICPDVTVL